ncbi:hypothetical protein [Myroides sp. DW712]|uniref:hypothetical protein n=1 Tax=Myroides sp. DW712 TaxID=3389800 RepID=UPI00397E8795
MKLLVFSCFFLFLYSSASYAQHLTDWQIENLKGKVKQMTSIIQVIEGDTYKKEVFYFDERGFLTRKEIFVGIKERGEEEVSRYNKIGELQNFEYQEQKRQGMSLQANGSKAADFVQQWQDEQHCQLHYTYHDAPEKKGVMQYVFSNKAKLEEMYFILRDMEVNEVLFESKSIFQYDSIGQVNKMEQHIEQPYGDTLLHRFITTNVDAQENVVQRLEYDENSTLFARILYSYVYYE